MSIPIITNFRVNTALPIDSRLVATNSAALSEIVFPYEGLTVFTKDQNLNYTYNGTSWAVSSNGIYGGSGSMVGTTDVNFGLVGSSLDSRASDLIFSASSSTTDRTQLVTSFIRNEANGEESTTVEVRQQTRFLDNGALLNGPYISFNKTDSKKGIISLGTPTRNFTQTVERFRIDPDSLQNNGAVVIIPTTYSQPIYISNTDGITTFIGYNWDGTSKSLSGTGSAVISFENSGVISLGNVTSAGTQVINQLVIGEETDQNTMVSVRVDTFGKDLGASSMPRNFNYKTIVNVTRDLEHKYTKLQSFNYHELDSYSDGLSRISFKSIVTNQSLVYINGEGNFFDFELPANNGGSTIKDIRIVRNDLNGTAYISDLLPGTEIKIRFTYEAGFASGKECIIKLYQALSGHQDRKIISHFADEVGGGDLTIVHNPSTNASTERNQKQSGDIITFVRGDGFWYVTNINREKFILDQLSTSSGILDWTSLESATTLFSDPSLDINNDTLGMLYLNMVTNDLGTRTGFEWAQFTGTMVYNVSGRTQIDHPFKYTMNTTLDGTTALVDSNLTSFNAPTTLRITKDTLGYVRMKGAFRINNIPLNNLSIAYNDGIGNQIYFAYIGNASHRPTNTNTSENYLTAWGLCEVVVSSSVSAGMPFGGKQQTYMGRIKVYPTGRVVLSFQMTNYTTSLSGNYTLDVNVPEFSYPTN